MKTTGSNTKYDNLEMNPEIPFLKDLANDLRIIDKQFSKQEASEIKKKMVAFIISNI